MKGTVLVTGSAGLIGSEAVRFFHQLGFDVVGLDNGMRKYFFGPDGDTTDCLKEIMATHKNYTHVDIDIRNNEELTKLFKNYSFDLIIHAAAQPSHDWAAREPLTDFSVNALGTLHLLEALRHQNPEAVFIFLSTNKVYGDTPNRLPLIEMETRFEIDARHAVFNGIDESMSIDQNLHSLFGVSKASADLMVQEYGRYFGLKTASFRCGCLTGPQHAGAELHGFLAYLAKCVHSSREYKIFGYKGKQVRDNIHAYDLVNAFWHFYKNPRQGEVYNMGGSRYSNISLREAILYFENRMSKHAKVNYLEQNRRGDHIWYVSDVTKFKSHYPEWSYKYNIERILDEICEKGNLE